MNNHANKAAQILLDRMKAKQDHRLPTKLKRCKRTGKIVNTGTLRCGLTQKQVAALSFYNG